MRTQSIHGGPLICLNEKGSLVLSGIASGNSRTFEIGLPEIFTNVFAVRNQIEGLMYEWSEWSECSNECIRKRFRTCPPGYNCKEGTRQKRNCSIEREFIGLHCWKEKTDSISSSLETCKMEAVTTKSLSHTFQSRIVQGNGSSQARD